MSTTIQTLVNEVHKIAVDHGWWEQPKTFTELLCLVHSEVSEALEYYREGLLVNEKQTNSDGKPVDIPSELADVIIRIFDMCGYYGIDIERAIVEKIAYNKTRPYKHGGKKL